MRMLVLLLALGACTTNSSAKLYGGDMSVALKCDVKLFDITWKEDSFWYAVRPMRADEPAEVYTFQEKSSFGVMEGSVTVKECRSHPPIPPVG